MPQNHRLAGLVLAAGGGSRLGGGKLLLPWRGKPILLHVLDAAARIEGIASLTLVLGHDAIALRLAVADQPPPFPPPLRVTENPLWQTGLGTSLHHGLEAVLATPAGDGIDSVMVMLGDQPLVAAETLNRLAQAHAEALSRDPGHPATAPLHAGRRGNPVILSRPMFPHVLALDGDVGARGLLAGLGERLRLVPVEDPGVLFDVDTPEAYAELCAKYP